MSGDRVVGMMDDAYFVGRRELLEFFNELLDLRLSKIEETATGAVACQLVDYMFPGSVPLSRINWGARSDYEFVENYKLLQNAFEKNKVRRFVDVPKLIRAKYQDNLEFCQWMKAFFDQSGSYREDYDAVAVREKGKGGKRYNESMGKSNGKVGSSKSRPTRSTNPTKPRVSSRSKAPLRPAENKARPTRSNSVSKHRNEQRKPNPTDAKLVAKNAELEKRVDELVNVVADVEKERDFYFGKLRNIELFLQIKQDQNFDGCEREDIVDNLFKVLYATADDDVIVGGDGQIVPASSQEQSSKEDESADLSAALDSNEDDSNILPSEIVDVAEY